MFLVYKLFKSGDYYYIGPTRMYKNFRSLIEPRSANERNQKHASNLAPRKYNIFIQRNTYLTI